MINLFKRYFLRKVCWINIILTLLLIIYSINTKCSIDLSVSSRNTQLRIHTISKLKKEIMHISGIALRLSTYEFTTIRKVSP